MKSYLLVTFSCALSACFCISCSETFHNNNNTHLTVSENEQQYKVLANYPEENTRKVETYLNDKIGDKNNISFTNSAIDAQLTLDDGTKMYVKNEPGTLEIKLDKEKNSTASYQEVKALGEGLKPFLDKDK